MPFCPDLHVLSIGDVMFNRRYASMAEFLLKYADARGQIKEQVAEADSEGDLRDKFAQQGFLIYSIKPTGKSLVASLGVGSGRKRINMEKFLIFNQQFLTLVRAGLPILKCLDLLADRLTDPKLGKYVQVVRDEVRNGALLSDAFGAAGVFPPIYVTSIMAGEKSGALVEVLERYLAYQRLSLSVRKKLMLALIYPAVLIVLVTTLIVFMVTYVVPQFATLYAGLSADLPGITQMLITVGTVARDRQRASLGRRGARARVAHGARRRPEIRRPGQCRRPHRRGARRREHAGRHADRSARRHRR